MRRLVLACFLMLPALSGAHPAVAKTCTMDTVPAATLLLPYFEVDLKSATGRTTLVAIDNASDRAVLAHVVLWTDLGVPTLAFDVYLTGYDVQTINLRDLFTGHLPATADAARDPQDTVSPRGVLSGDATFAGCDGLLPPPPLSAAVIDHLARAHQGLASPLLGGSCAAQAFGDQVARGYATVDVTRRCTSLTPADPGYFGPDGVAASDNVLWGDFFLVDPAGNVAAGEDLVRIEADPARFAGHPTFYERYVGSSGSDGREPLPTIWESRFLNGGSFSGGTDLIYWRDSRHRDQPFPCGHPPVWYPFPWEFSRTVFFDEQENPVVPGCPFPFECTPFPSPFPAESGRVVVGSPALPVPFTFGWLFLDMKTTPGGRVDPPATQAWLSPIHQSSGAFNIGLEADPADSGCTPGTFIPHP
ncbi:MAG TPA: hypothetical protein VGG20_00305 [Thermoanaerobaculia bacterium]|jgi:hypothetical protein